VEERRARGSTSAILSRLTLLFSQVYGAGTEDMDTLTFNSPILLRHLTFSEARKLPIEVIKLEDRALY
jgi:hypothetical protein